MAQDNLTAVLYGINDLRLVSMKSFLAAAALAHARIEQPALVIFSIDAQSFIVGLISRCEPVRKKIVKFLLINCTCMYVL